MKKILLTGLLFLGCIWVSQAQLPDYCIPTYGTGCTSGDEISDLIMNDIGINNLNTDCEPNGYSDFTSISSLQGDAVIGESFNFTVNHGPNWNQSLRIWIDLDGDGIFDMGDELLFESTVAALTHSGEITIPLDAVEGVTTMRVMCRFGGWTAANDSCDPGSTFGETHDYQIDLLPAADCPRPLGVSIDNITGVSAEVNFSTVDAAVNGYTWEIFGEDDDVEEDTPLFTGTIDAGEESVIIDGLDSETTYQVVIISDCDDNGVSIPTNPATFTTLEGCVPPSTITLTAATADSVNIEWSVIPNAVNGYTWFIFNGGANPDTATPVATGTEPLGTNSVSVTDLPSGSVFDVYVSADCGEDDGESTLSEVVSFQTTCAIFEAPYFENFDGSTWVSGTGFANADYEIDQCWDNDEPAPGFFWGTRTGASNSAGTGPNDDVSGGGNYVYLRTSGGVEGDIAFLQGPPVDISDLETPTLSFFYHMFGPTIGTLSVEVRPLGEDIWIEVFSISGEQQTSADADWIETFVDLEDFEDDDIIEFRFLGERGSSFTGNKAVDNVLIDNAPTCFNVENLAFISATEDEATFEWDENVDAIDGYVWDVFTEGSSPFDDDAVLEGSTPTNSVTISGLDASTVYIFRVRSDCGDEDGLSSPGVTVTFQTACDVINAPYSENFDGSTWIPGTGFANADYELDQCWNNDEPFDGLFWGTRTGATNSGGTGPNDDVSGGGNYVYLRTSGTSPEGETAFLSGPLIDISDLNEPTISFYYHMFGPGMGSLALEVRAVGDSDWTEVFTISGQQQGSSDDDWIQEFVLLDNFEDDDVIEFRFLGIKGSAFTSNMAVDNVAIDNAPSCFSVTGFSAAPAVTTALLTWNEVPSAIDGYDLEVFEQGEDAPFLTENIDQVETSFEVTGLEEGETYIATITSNCGDDGGISETNEITFTTVSLGDTCEAAIVVDTLPYITTDDTANYSDFYTGPPGADCGATSAYLSGNDVTYTFTPDEDMVVLVTMDPTAAWSGIFVYESCDDIGSQCLNGIGNANTNPRQFEISLTGGEDYFFVISTWPAPQTTAYTFELTQVLCGSVGGLDTTFVGSTEIDFTWDAVPGAIGYDWFLFNNGDNPESDTPIQSGSTTDTDIFVDGLNGGTGYDFYVLSECDDDAFGELTGPFTVVTNCEPETVPTVVEDFSNANFNYNTNELMPCWSEGTGALTTSMSITIANGTWGAGNYANTANTPNGQAARINLFGTGTSWLMSQEIDLGDGTEDLVIEYDVSVVPWSGGNIDSPQVTDMGQHTVDVVVSTDGGDTWSNLDIVETYDNTNIPSPDQTDLVSLDGYTGVVKIGFYANRITSTDLWFSIDNFRVIVAPTCLPPLNLDSQIVGVAEMELSWDLNPINAVEDQWEVQYGLEGFELDSDDAESIIVNGNPQVVITDLASTTDYEFYVRALCDEDDFSEWRGPHGFRSPIVPIEIGAGESHNTIHCYGNFEVSEWLYVSTANEELTMVFNAGSVEESAGSDDVLRIYDGFSDEGILLHDTSVDGAVLAGLSFTATSGAFYMILTSDIVQSCQGGQGELPEEFDIDVFSETFSSPEFGAEQFSYYPNPVKTSLNIQSQNPVEAYQLFNMQGKRLAFDRPNTNTPSINMQDLPTGVYLLKVRINGNSETYQIIKK